MTESSPSAIGTVAQEAARLIEDMATMARSGYSRDKPSSYGGGPGQRPAPSDPPPEAGTKNDYESWDTEDPGTQAWDAEETRFEESSQSARADAQDEPTADACSMCGAERADAPGRDTPSSCRLCPVCRGIDLLRSVRPETVDLLADLAMSVAASLRDVAVRSRASERASSDRSTTGRPREPNRATVQDIPVDDESED
jgi:hypothetical protein